MAITCKRMCKQCVLALFLLLSYAPGNEARGSTFSLGAASPSVYLSLHHITMHMTNLSSPLPGLPPPFLHIASTQTWDGGEGVGQKTNYYSVTSCNSDVHD